MEDVLDENGKVIGFKMNKDESSHFAAWIKKKIKEDKPVETINDVKQKVGSVE